MSPDAVARAAAADRSGYVAYHAPRYRHLLDLAAAHHQAGERVLDIGPSPFTGLLATQLGCEVDTLGFGEDRTTATGRHHAFDLNAAEETGAWRRDLPAYGLLVFAEVLEHLHTAPVHVLGFLRSLLTPGGRLIVQTPNAVVAHKRVQMLLGRNPFHPISESRFNPAHFREYTRRELVAELRRAGFQLRSATAGAYFDYRYAAHARGRAEPAGLLAVVNVAYRLLPGSLRPGLSAVAQRPREDPPAP